MHTSRELHRDKVLRRPPSPAAATTVRLDRASDHPVARAIAGALHLPTVQGPSPSPSPSVRGTPSAAAAVIAPRTLPVRGTLCATRPDYRGDAVTGATAAALDAFERALATFQSWRTGADDHIAVALQEAPGFVMAYVLRAYLCLGSRDRRRVLSARPLLERARVLPANVRERAHLAAIEAVLADDYERARALLAAILRDHPRDALALQIVHSFDYAGGDAEGMRHRVPGVLPAWSEYVPGYHAVLAMHAFGLEESGEYERAEEVGRHALDLNPFDARAHHAVAHVFEMTGRAEAGVRWMFERVAYWGADTLVTTHCWWHLALHRLELGQIERALRLYDRRVRAGHSLEVADLIDAAALLWRVDLAGGEAGERWDELASAWAPHIGDRFCSFNDVHAMLAFVGARDWQRAARLERELTLASRAPNRHGETTRRAGLAACRGLIAFGRGDYAEAVASLGSLPAAEQRLGGSHAQRDVLQLTLLRSVERFRMRGRSVRVAA